MDAIYLRSRPTAFLQNGLRDSFRLGNKLARVLSNREHTVYVFREIIGARQASVGIVCYIIELKMLKVSMDIEAVFSCFALLMVLQLD